MNTGPPRASLIVDARGLFCPAPIIEVSDALRKLASGAVVELISDDPAIESDLPAWCRSTGHAILSSDKRGDDFHYLVRKS